MAYTWRGKALPTVAPRAAPVRKPKAPRGSAAYLLIKRIESQARRRAFNDWRQANPEMYEREWSAALIMVAGLGGSTMTPSARHSRARSIVITKLSTDYPDLWKPLYDSKKEEVAQEPKYAA